MTSPTFEIKETDALRPFELRVIDPTDEQAFAEWLDLRQRFVEAQGWREGNDFDMCDANPDTIHVVAMEKDKIIAGMRLTPFSRPQETLSWSMLTDEMKQEAEMKLPIDEENAGWDLTRLVIGEGLEKARLVEAFMEMLGAGYALTKQVEDNPRWYFTTSLPVFMFFARQGVEFTALSRGEITPGDGYECVFSYADAAERTEWLGNATKERYVENYKAVQHGMEFVSKEVSL